MGRSARKGRAGGVLFCALGRAGHGAVFPAFSPWAEQRQLGQGQQVEQRGELVAPNGRPAQCSRPSDRQPAHGGCSLAAAAGPPPGGRHSRPPAPACTSLQPPAYGELGSQQPSPLRAPPLVSASGHVGSAYHNLPAACPSILGTAPPAGSIRKKKPSRVRRQATWAWQHGTASPRPYCPLLSRRGGRVLGGGYPGGGGGRGHKVLVSP